MLTFIFIWAILSLKINLRLRPGYKMVPSQGTQPQAAGILYPYRRIDSEAYHKIQNKIYPIF